MAAFTLTFIRHGETVSNKERRIQGQKNTALSAVGKQQAELCGLYLQNEQFTHAYSSDLDRAYKTCEIILSKNKKTTCNIIQDVRLRERKFGIFEGKERHEFVAAAKKAKKKFDNFIPEGAENMSQVQERAVEFFADLYKHMKSLAEKEGSIDNPVSIKRRRITGSSCSDVFPFPESPTDDSAPITINCNSNISPTKKEEQLRSCSSTSSSGCSSLSSAESIENLLYLNENSLDQPNDESSSSLGQDSVTSTEECSGTTTPVLASAWDLDIQASIKAPKAASIYSCPNVSLSPLFAHRLPSMSSISSGRNSFDDGELVPHVVAEVLLVSHGGLLKELTSYFISLDCKISGGRRLTSQISPNTGISKFSFTLTDDGPPVVTCLIFHNKDHLSEASCHALENGGEV